MLELNTKLETCIICRNGYTSRYVEAAPGVKIYICENCLEAAKFNFIWLCTNCGKVYMKPKASVIKKIKDRELKKAYILYEDMQVIHGIDMCILCDPEGILNYMETDKMGMEC